MPGVAAAIQTFFQSSDCRSNSRHCRQRRCPPRHFKEKSSRERVVFPGPDPARADGPAPPLPLLRPVDLHRPRGVHRPDLVVPVRVPAAVAVQRRGPSTIVEGVVDIIVVWNLTTFGDTIMGRILINSVSTCSLPLSLHEEAGALDKLVHRHGDAVAADCTLFSYLMALPFFTFFISHIICHLFPPLLFLLSLIYKSRKGGNLNAQNTFLF